MDVFTGSGGKGVEWVSGEMGGLYENEVMLFMAIRLLQILCNS